MIITILVFLLILTVLVLIHEAGHFFVAKFFKIKVEEFGIGLPPRVWGIRKGETIYSINLLPIGGFVKLYGEDDAGGGKPKLKSSSDKPKVDISRAFFARPIWQRASVVLAGVFMNFVLATVIITYFFGIVGVSVPGDKVIITDIVENSPAHEAGLRKDDDIRSINGEEINNPNQLISITRKHLGEEIILGIERKGEVNNFKLSPRKDYPDDEGPLGVAIAPNIVSQKYPLWQAPFIGIVESLKNSWLIVSGLWGVVYSLVTLAQVPSGVAGPVGIAQLTGQFVELGPLAVLSFVSLLSLNLAVLNVLPIPALDGGRLFFILIEAVVGKKISRKFEGTTHAIGMALLLGLLAVITLSDIIRAVSGQPVLPGQ